MQNNILNLCECLVMYVRYMYVCTGGHMHAHTYQEQQ